MGRPDYRQKPFLKRLLPLVLITILAANCAGARIVEPLDEGKHRASLDIGGPFIDLFDLSFPLPQSSLNYAYGIDSKWSAFGSFYITSALFGVIHLEGGALYGIFEPQGWIPGLSIKPSAHIMTDIYQWNFRFYPVVDLEVYWRLREKQDIIYLGMSNWFELSATRAHGQAQPQNWLPQFHLGYIIGLGEWHLSFEAQYIAPNVSSENLALIYSFDPGMGVFGFHIGFGREF